MKQIGKGFIVENEDCFMGRRRFVIDDNRMIYLRILGEKLPKKRNIFVIEDEFEDGFTCSEKRRVVTKKQFLKEYEDRFTYDEKTHTFSRA